MKTNIIFLCANSENVRERLGYTRAFAKQGFYVSFCENEFSFIDTIQKIEHQTLAIIHPEPYNSFHTISSWDFNIPTIIFQWDNFNILTKRILASKPYDMQVICHPRFKQYFHGHGCRKVLVLPWCIDDSLIASNIDFVGQKKVYDIGWIGRSDAEFYNQRREILRLILTKEYKINDVDRYYSWEEMFEVFQQSKIVINVSRDDFAEDANMRCFEAMGCGALLLTEFPTELEEIGLNDGIHFATYTSNDDLIQKINFYLKNENERCAIAKKGKDEVLHFHTYSTRVASLIDFLKVNSKECIENNAFRKLSEKEKFYWLAFCFIKDGNLKMLLKMIAKTSIIRKIQLSKHLFVLKLKQVKKRLI